MSNQAYVQLVAGAICPRVALNMLRGHLQNIGFPQQLGLQKVVFML